MIKTRYWVLIILVILIIGIAFLVSRFLVNNDYTIANVYQNGECIYSVDLSKVEEAYEFTIESEWGENTIRVETGRIRFLDADCNDRICVESGWLSSDSSMLVCLPHRLIIRIEATANSSDIDTVAE